MSSHDKPTTSTPFTNEKKKSIIKADEGKKEVVAGNNFPISTLAKIASEQEKLKKNKGREVEEGGVWEYAYRFGLIKELQEMTLKSAKSAPISGKGPINKYTTINLKATSIDSVTATRGNLAAGSSTETPSSFSGLPQDGLPDGNLSNFKQSDHHRLANFHYHDFVKHYCELDDNYEDLNSIQNCEHEKFTKGSTSPPTLPPRNSPFGNSTWQQMDFLVDMETFQGRKEKIFAGEQMAPSNLECFFPLCRSLCVKTPNRSKSGKKDVGVAEMKTNKGKFSMTEITAELELLILRLQNLQKLVDQHIAGLISENEKNKKHNNEENLRSSVSLNESCGSSWSPVPPPPPPPKSTAPPSIYPKNEHPDDLPSTEFCSKAFANILRLLAKVKATNTDLFLALMETIFQAFLSGQTQNYRFYDTLACQVLTLLEPHFSLYDDEDIVNCLGFWL